MANDDISTARRNLVRGAALGLAASAASVAAPSLMAATNDAPQVGAGVSANGSSSGVGSSPRDVALVDPRGEYPHPPFAAQTQAWPGLASRMNPRPDHGETSYVGSGKLAGRKALITGGDPGLGRAAAIAYAREGADVAINYLPAEEEDAREVVALIRAAGRKAVPIPGDLRQEAFCQQLVERAATELGGLDILVNCAGRQHSHESVLDITTGQVFGASGGAGRP